MKSFCTSLFFSVISLFAVTHLKANQVIVKGHVLFADGKPAANRTVTISADTSSAGVNCPQFHLKITNQDGFYMDTLTCPDGTIVKVYITTTNCDGKLLVHNPQVPPSNIVENNFTICNLPLSCEAAYQFSSAAGSLVVNSNSSASHGSSVSDSIIRRVWRFGDADTLGGNVVSPSHTFKTKGSYQTCLTIFTAAGCEKTICKTIALADTQRVPVCRAEFSYAASSASYRQIKFNSNSSSGGDSIISRTWSFGDSSNLTGNIKDPQHTYQQDGNYTVCLRIKTVLGCESSICRVVTIRENRCKAKFTYTVFPSFTGLVIKFNSSTSETAAGDSIRERIWRFGDGTSLSGNAIDPVHSYSTGGPFNVCLVIRSSKGCVDSICITVPASQPPLSCKSGFTYTVLPTASVTGFGVKFNSNTSETAAGDSIRERIWQFGDGSSLSGNVVDPVHIYNAGGPFKVCLVIRSSKGCVDSTCVIIRAQIPDSCRADFTYTKTGTTVKFVSNASQSDSIVSRSWQFGDGTALAGNIKDPAHTYARAGTYTVCLTIRTGRNCESKECKQVTITDTAITDTSTVCNPRFTIEQISPKKIRFNSSTSSVPANDNIIQRKWDFGDGSPVLSGNITDPVKEYNRAGIYTACLQIKTIKGCERKFCTTVKIQDTLNTPPNAGQVKIILLYPTPVRQQLTSVIWSLHNNVNVQLSIHDIYGVKKWSMSKRLLQGNNVTVIPTGLLLPGPYFFKVTSMYGVQSRQFFKF